MKNIKTYETCHGNLSTVVRVGDCNIRIRFISKDNVHGYYATTDVAVQEAIESDSGYGVKFTLFEEAVSPCKKEPDLRAIPEITTWQGAKELLREAPYSIPAKELSSPGKIERAAQKAGIIFTALKV